MKKIILLFIFSLIFSPAYAVEDVQDTAEDEINDEEIIEDEIESNYKQIKLRKKAQISPKKEHDKTMYKANKSLERYKSQFQKRKEKELYLLNEEYNVLDYHP